MHVLQVTFTVYLRFLVLATASLALATQVDSETNLQCNETYAWSYDWASNSAGKDVCQQLSVLYDTCAPNTSPLSPLVFNASGENSYPGPNSSVQNICTCSYVMYNLMSACGDCQVGLQAPNAWPTYRAWAESCSVSNEGGIYPNAIPSSLANTIPLWAQFSTKDTGDPRWSYGVSKGVATGRFIPNINFISSANVQTSATCSSHRSVGLPIGTAFIGFVGGIVFSFLAVFLYRRRSARVIPPPARYHTAPDNTPLHPLLPRSAHSFGTNLLRRIFEQDDQPGRIEPYDITTAATSRFPPHPAAFPPSRVPGVPPILTIAPSHRGPSRQPSTNSLSPVAFSAYPSLLTHSRSNTHMKPSSRPQTANSQLSIGQPQAGPSTLAVIPHSLLPSPTEPPSPLNHDGIWSDSIEEPPAYRRKS